MAGNRPYSYINLPLKETFYINLLIDIDILLRGLVDIIYINGYHKTATTPINTGFKHDGVGQKHVTNREIRVGDGEKVCNNGLHIIYNIWGKSM